MATNVYRISPLGLNFLAIRASQFSTCSVNRERNDIWRERTKPLLLRHCKNPLLGNLQKRRGLERNPTRFGPLTNRPDYSFLDGRPVPIGGRLKNRLETQKKFAERIVRLSKEMDFAIEREAENKRLAEEEKQRILKSKLRPKGTNHLRK